MIEYPVATDILLIKELLGVTLPELADASGVGAATLNRWLEDESRPSRKALEALYSFAYCRGLRLNAIKAQLGREELEAIGRTVLFHGAKSEISGPLSLDHSRPNNDFGRGFYCGESLEQAAMFVAAFPTPSLYVVGFDPRGLSARRFHVDEDWMLAVAWFRGRLDVYAGHPRVEAIVESVAQADYVVAPIADNRMYEVIDSFIDGEITDVQCRHSLSATNLGNQYVFTSEAALAHLELVERCYLAEVEKAAYLAVRRDETQMGFDKAKAARRKYRGQGVYIEELFS